MEKYNKKKAGNQVMTEFSSDYVSAKMQKRITECGDWLRFMADKPIEKRKLTAANFCKWRFCPMCAWRKAVRDTACIDVMMQHINKTYRKEFIFLSLTAPNVPAEQLRDEVTRYNRAFKTLIKRKEVEGMNFGFIRKLEITYNPERHDYHPHLHIVFAVNRGYFSGGRYVKQQQWLELWREVMKDPSITQVDVRRVKRRNDSREMSESFAVAEFAKYAAKDADYTHDVEVFRAFYTALKGRQTLSFGGLFKEAVDLYKNDKLKEYIKEDATEYYWNLVYEWGGSEYAQREKTPLDAVDRFFLEKRGLYVDDEIPDLFDEGE